jgi:mycofactocin system glycosyltransferase
MATSAVALAEVAARYRARTVALVAVDDPELHRAAIAALAPEVRLIDAEDAEGARDRALDVELTVTSVAERLADLSGRVFLLKARGADEQRALRLGFVLEESRPEGAVFLRTEAPRYRLLGGALVWTQGKRAGPALRLERPHLVLHLSPGAAAVLGALPGTAEEVARTARISVARVTAIVHTFVARGIVLREAPRKLSRPPRVTVVIPAYQRPEATRATIESALDLAYPADRFDIVVVDDASPEPLVFPDLPPERVRVLRLAANGGPAIARNAGLRAATGELVAFLDNDCTVTPDWLSILAATLEEAEVDIAGGRALPPPSRGHGILAAYEAVRSPLDMGKTGGAVGLGETVPYLPSCNLLVRRSTAQRLGGFRDGMHLGEDVDFVWRARESRSKVMYEPAATIVHHHRERLGEMLRRRAEYASSEALLVRLHPASRRVLVLPVTVLLALASLSTLASLRYLHTGAALAVAAVTLLVVDVVAKVRRLRDIGLPARGVSSAVLRAQGASLYHLSAAVSRYLGLPLIALALLVPALAPAAVVLLATYPLLDARLRGARLMAPLYVALYTLDMAAYQIGILRGRIAHRSLLLPRIKLRR